MDRPSRIDSASLYTHTGHINGMSCPSPTERNQQVSTGICRVVLGNYPHATGGAAYGQVTERSPQPAANVDRSPGSGLTSGMQKYKPGRLQQLNVVPFRIDLRVPGGITITIID
ncbi:hypothetical protein MAPG_08474 [Magnaporthiopsis poae ATCC 64411]|uniref:Uncharacterized protein n=1 Tax=Magnaporthiopsis poae (strain ATCC 64411 / 73-15) TaxID=644358 RepID=A0A0C4E7G1_MAGP6|nr:hypothetical protein MAPG_08474 [Magnaporthiopsis poae ATCC 64411]